MRVPSRSFTVEMGVRSLRLSKRKVHFFYRAYHVISTHHDFTLYSLYRLSSLGIPRDPVYTEPGSASFNPQVYKHTRHNKVQAKVKALVRYSLVSIWILSY